MRVIICGAGIAGLTLAWWLHHDGWDVTVLERGPAARGGGYMMDFVGPGYDTADRMGLLPALRKIQTGIRAVQYRDARGRPRGRIDYDSFASAVHGRLFSFMHGDLHRVLTEAVADHIEIRYTTTVAAAVDTTDGVTVTDSDGSRETVDLLVGADGVHSRVRSLLFDTEPAALRPLGYHTASYFFTDAELHQRVGAQFLLIAEPGIQAGLYPVGDDRLATWLIEQTTDPLPADPADRIRAVYRRLGEPITTALRHCPTGRDLYYDLVAQISVRPWCRDHVALIGDAAGAVSLMAGQGGSLAMAGADILAAQLRSGAGLPVALSRYEAELRPLVEQAQRAGRRTAAWLVPATRTRLTVRAAALRLLALPGGSALLRRSLSLPL